MDLTIVYLQDENSGDFTAFYNEVPNATSQGRTKEEVKALLDEVIPFALEDVRAA